MPKAPQYQIMAAIRSYYELVDKGDIDGLLALFAENAIYHRPGYSPIIGRNGLARFYRSQRVIDCGRHVVINLLIDNDGGVAVEGTFAGRLRDGNEVNLRFADFFGLDESVLIETRNTYFFAPLV
jgi:ketosteroid isomerase-like protein